MYLHTRLLLGIGVVTIAALIVSLLVPLQSVRVDVARETGASMQLAQLLLDVQHAVNNAAGSDAARLAARDEIRRARDLRHIRITFLDDSGTIVATSPAEEPRASTLTRALLSSSPATSLIYPVKYHSERLGELKVASNPLSEFAEIEQRVADDLTLLTLTVLAMGAAIYVIVQRGLRPVALVQDALGRLQSGHLDTRLPRFKLKDVDDISQRFNQCAAAMEETAALRRDLTRRLIDAEEEERRRLARELHDELGQSLTAIKVDAAYIAREGAKTGTANIVDSAHAIEQLSSSIMELIRSMLARLRPHGLETVGLRESLNDLVNGWQARVADRFQCTLSIQGNVDVLAPGLNITVYRLIQECLTNAVRHSRARRIGIRLSLHAGATGVAGDKVLVDVIEEQMSGEDVRVGGSGTGMLGMRERVEAQGGELTIGTGPTGGLSLHAWMPVQRHDSEVIDA